MKDPTSFYGKTNAQVLLLATPEFSDIKRLRGHGAGRSEPRVHDFAIKPEFKQIDGKSIRFARGGNSEGATILMLCPLPQSILCFDAIWRHLEADFNLVALDLPGFGRSEGGLEVMSFEAQSAFLEKFVADQALENFHIVGPDVGMAVGLHYVMHREHKATSLLVGDGPGILPTANGSIINKAVDSAFWRALFPIAGAGAFVGGAYQLACLNYVPSHAEVDDYIASYDGGRIGPVCHWFKTYPENLATTDPYLENLELPVQLFWGDKDVFLTTDNAKRLDQRIPRSQLKIFDHCGHFSYQDKADEFAVMVRDWVSGGYQQI